MKQAALIKSLLVVKGLLLFGAGAYYLKAVRIGENDLVAAGEEKPADAPEKSEGKDSSAADKSPTAESKGRKSFLDDLLNLPELDPTPKKKEDFAKYLNIAERKKRQVEERLVMLKKREEQLILIEQSIDKKIVKIEDEKKYIAQVLQKEKDLKGERLKKLIELYEKMEPKKAAPVIEKLDKDLVVALFKELKQKTVTLILENMSPEKSVELTEYYGRVRSGKEYELLKELNASLRKEFDECKGMPPAEPAVQKAEAKPEVSPATAAAPAPSTSPEAKAETAAATPAPSPEATKPPATAAADNKESKG